MLLNNISVHLTGFSNHNCPNSTGPVSVIICALASLSKYINVLVFFIASCSFSKPSACSFFHWNEVLFMVSLRRGSEIVSRFGMNFAVKVTSPTKDLTSALVSGFLAFYTA